MNISFGNIKNRILVGSVLAYQTSKQNTKSSSSALSAQQISENSDSK